MVYSGKLRAYLTLVALLAVPLAACQSTSGADPAPAVAEAPPVVAEPPPAVAEPAVSEPQATVQPASGETAAVPVVQAATPQPADSSDAEAELVFLDFAGFDEDLAREMSAERGVIAVDVPAAFSLNAIPDRLDRWFFRVKQTGGTVQARENPGDEERRTRGIVGVLLEIAVSAAKAHEAEEMLRPAQDYNVLVEYDKQSGKANRVLFYRR